MPPLLKECSIKSLETGATTTKSRSSTASEAELNRSMGSPTKIYARGAIARTESFNLVDLFAFFDLDVLFFVPNFACYLFAYVVPTI